MKKKKKKKKKRKEKKRKQTYKKRMLSYKAILQLFRMLSKVNNINTWSFGAVRIDFFFFSCGTF